MDSRHHQGRTDNRFRFRYVRTCQKRTELCVTTFLRRGTFSRIADAITEWLSLKSEVRYFSHTPVIPTVLPFEIGMVCDMMGESFFIE